MRYANDLTHRNSRKTQHFNYFKLCYLFLYFGIFHPKSVIMLVLCLDLVKIIFVHFYSVFLKCQRGSERKQRRLVVEDT